MLDIKTLRNSQSKIINEKSCKAKITNENKSKKQKKHKMQNNTKTTL